MKTIVLFFDFFLLALASIGQTIPYYPLPSENAIWVAQSGGYQSGYCADYQDSIKGDTLINGMLYLKLQRTGIRYCEDQYGFCTYFICQYLNHYIGAFRNDSLNRKVFYFDPCAEKDTILYDFNLELYDTLPTTYLYDPVWGISFVEEIDSILLGNQYHKRFKISHEWGAQDYVDLIEGVGGTAGILGLLSLPFEAGSSLKCFIQNGQTVFPDTNYQCDLITSTSDLPTNETISISIFPNPVSDFAYINVNQTDKAVDMTVSTILGAEIFRFNNLSQSTKIDFSALKSGIYIYQVIQGRKILLTGKLLKIK